VWEINLSLHWDITYLFEWSKPNTALLFNLFLCLVFIKLIAGSILSTLAQEMAKTKLN
jgi:hypothetical protein